MCKYCEGEFGKDFSIIKHHTGINQPNSGQIINTKTDTLGIVLWNNKTASGCFDIKYCPFCGKKII